MRLCITSVPYDTSDLQAFIHENRNNVLDQGYNGDYLVIIY